MVDFEATRAAKFLLRESSTGALGTLLPDGAPYVSSVTIASSPDGSPLLLLSKLARHTTNIFEDSRVSLLLANVGQKDPLANIRMSVSGRIVRTYEASARRRFLARHPSAETYAGFADFGFWRIDISGAHLIGGFGRIVDLTSDQLRTDLDGAEDLLASEEGAVNHMNEDHRDAILLYATKLLDCRGENWRIVSLDPEGCDLQQDQTVRRLVFPARVTSSQALRKTMVALVEKARKS
jgi:heme iron utilization protein